MRQRSISCAAASTTKYFEQGVQDWFDANLAVPAPDGNRNMVATRAALEPYDPVLAALLAMYLPSDDWRFTCP